MNLYDDNGFIRFLITVIVMKKATKWIIRILKCLICLITGAYKDKDKDNDKEENGNSHGNGNGCDGNRCNNAN